MPGLTQVSKDTIELVRSLDRPTARDLAELMRVSLKNMYGRLNRLERLNHLYRVCEDDKDKPVWKVRTSPQEEISRESKTEVLSLLVGGDKTAAEIAEALGVKVRVLLSTLHKLRYDRLIETKGYRKEAYSHMTSVWGLPAEKREPQTPLSLVALHPLPPLHKTITAAFCGDPLPGRSALDQRRAGK